MAFAPPFQRPFSATFDRRAAVAVTPWWLAGGVAAATCLAAYTPKGKASLALSYNNDAAPGNGLADGTYDAAPGTAPTFDASGWTFNGSTQYLTTGVTPENNQSWSMLVCYASTTNLMPLAGLVDVTGNSIWFILAGVIDTVSSVQYGNGKVVYISPTQPSGVIGFAGNTAYRNGIAESTTIGTEIGTISCAITIAARNVSGSIDRYNACNIQALAIYNVTLTSTQVLAISTAMAAL